MSDTTNNTLSRSQDHSFYGYYNRFYQKSADPKAAELFEQAEPSWFAQGYEGQPPQMCYTDEGFIAQVAQDARDYFDGKGARPGASAAGDCFGLVPMDNGSYCTCAMCKAFYPPTEPDTLLFSNGQWSDYVFQFVNRVEILSVPYTPQTAAATNDLSCLDFAAAATITQWRSETGPPAGTGLVARACHDGDTLYLEFEDHRATTDDPSSASGWDFVASNQPDLPFYRLALGSDGRVAYRAYGDRKPYAPHARTALLAAAKGRPGRIRMAIPLVDLLPGGVEPGWTFYGNFARR